MLYIIVVWKCSLRLGEIDAADSESLPMTCRLTEITGSASSWLNLTSAIGGSDAETLDFAANVLVQYCKVS
jgi:hypothetical protein